MIASAPLARSFLLLRPCVRSAAHHGQATGPMGCSWKPCQLTPTTISASSLSQGVLPARDVRQWRCQAAANDSSFPWGHGAGNFQLNERYLEWDDSAQRRLIKIYVAQKLNQTVEWVDEALLEIAVLLPDLVVKLDQLKADLVLQLVAMGAPVLTAKLLAFRELLPSIDLSAVLAHYPWLILELDAAQLQEQLGRLRTALPGVDVEHLIERNPMMLRADIMAVLAEIRRLLPAGQDPVHVLLADPTIVLDMKASGLPASLEIDDGILP